MNMEWHVLPSTHEYSIEIMIIMTILVCHHERLHPELVDKDPSRLDLYTKDGYKVRFNIEPD